MNAHIRVAHAATPEETILRRTYNYKVELADGLNDMGLLFAAYIKDPAKSFIPMQERVAQSDVMNRWVTTIGSAAYLILPGFRTVSSWARRPCSEETRANPQVFWLSLNSWHRGAHVYPSSKNSAP